MSEEIEVVVIRGGLPSGDPDAMQTDQAAVDRAVAAALEKGGRVAIVGGLPE